MAFSGKMTAANHADLLATITAFITGDPSVPGRDWTVARQDALEWGPATVFRNTGLAGTEEVYVGLYAATKYDGISGGLVCKVYKLFNNGLVSDGGTNFLDTTIRNGSGQDKTHSLVPCWNNEISLWIWSNKARIIVVVNCNNLYANAYLGQLKRLCLPSENPFPLACFTDGYTSLWEKETLYGSITTGAQKDADSGRRSLIFTRRGVYPFSIYDNKSYYQSCHQICNPHGIWTSNFFMIPTTNYGVGSDSMKIDQGKKGSIGLFYGEKPRILLPVYVGTPNEIIGEMFGVYWIPDKYISPEDEINSRYVIFPDVSRVEWHSFMCIGDE